MGVNRVADAELLIIKEGVGVLGVNEQTVRRWDQTGKLWEKRRPISGYRLYTRHQILERRREVLFVTEKAL